MEDPYPPKTGYTFKRTRGTYLEAWAEGRSLPSGTRGTASLLHLRTLGILPVLKPQKDQFVRLH